MCPCGDKNIKHETKQNKKNKTTTRSQRNAHLPYAIKKIKVSWPSFFRFLVSFETSFYFSAKIFVGPPRPDKESMHFYYFFGEPNAGTTKPNKGEQPKHD